jgi:hypothetical protein
LLVILNFQKKETSSSEESSDENVDIMAKKNLSTMTTQPFLKNGNILPQKRKHLSSSDDTSINDSAPDIKIPSLKTSAKKLLQVTNFVFY